MVTLPPPSALFCSTILVAADDRRRQELSGRLDEEGLAPQACAALGEAFEEPTGARPELVVVDFVRGGTNAIAACRELQRWGCDVPLVGIFDEPSLDLLTPQLGIDEALMEPFTTPELRARLALLAWRRLGLEGPGLIAIDQIAVDPVRHVVTDRGRPVHLTVKEYELLRFLASNRGAALTRSRLLESVWGPEYLGGERTVDVHVRRLRSKLPSLDELLQTVHGVGYRLRE